jgi:hypothetical protein
VGWRAPRAALNRFYRGDFDWGGGRNATFLPDAEIHPLFGAQHFLPAMIRLQCSRRWSPQRKSRVIDLAFRGATTCDLTNPEPIEGSPELLVQEARQLPEERHEMLAIVEPSPGENPVRGIFRLGSCGMRLGQRKGFFMVLSYSYITG